MTTINYEAVKARRFESDSCGDDLPRAGSVRDQVRFCTPTPYPRRPAPLPAVNRNRDGAYFGVANDVAWVADQLLAYVTHAEHRDFARKTHGQRMDVLSAIRSLKTKLSRSTAGVDAHEELLARCQAISQRLAH